MVGKAMTTEVDDDALWTPSEERRTASGLHRFMTQVADRSGIPVGDYQALWDWSVQPGSGFWPSVAEFGNVVAEGDWSPERAPNQTGLSGAGWFPGIRLNYAEQALRGDDTRGPALIQVSEDHPDVEVSWSELRCRVASFAAQLRGWGIGPGDRVAGYLPSITETVVALLGSAAVGAVWTCCAPDFGADAVVDRFSQVQPRVLVAADGYRFAGRNIDCTATLRQLAQQLPSLEHVIVVPRIHGTVDLDVPVPVTPWADIIEVAAELFCARVPFDHPLWILYSSGTSGPPKGIVHSQGGIVVEHLKWLALHADVRAGDRFFWFSSTAWVVWNASVAALMVGATVVLYDGSPNRPRADRLWEIVASTAATQFGTSAGYLTASRRSGLTPGSEFDLSELRSVLYSGSVLPVDGWRWVYSHVKSDLWLDAPCGGTDVGTSFVGGNPLSPVRAGEIQCRLLGARVESWDDDGQHAVDRVGELVVTAPMPSMPIRFWNDPDGSRFHDAYFNVFPGVWRHGDWITITSRGTAVVHGRSDSTINRHGVRIGSADIYAALDRIPEITDSLVIGAELDDGEYWMPLFVTLVNSVRLDNGLRTRIAEEIRRHSSPRHIPDEILLAPAIPRTLTGKRLEVPVKRLLQGVDRDTAVNVGVVDHPEVLPWFSEIGARRRKEAECA